jgi:hypothetical protein
MERALFLKAVRSRAARIAATSSAARGRGNGGVVKAARRYLRKMDLSHLGTDDEAVFRAALNRRTERLIRKPPRGAQHWGLARKLLNIYLRDCLLTTYLNTAFYLARAEALFELPLDSITAHGLKQAGDRGALPVWPGVRHLTPKISAEFQRFAAGLVRREGKARVHLDAVYWSVARDEEGPGGPALPRGRHAPRRRLRRQ